MKTLGYHTPMFDFEQRITALRQELVRADLRAVVVAPTDHMRYLAGWSEPAGERFLALWIAVDDEPVFVAPELYAEDIERRMRIHAHVRTYRDSDDWSKCLPTLAVPGQVSIAVDDDLPTVHFLRLRASLPDAGWVACGPIMQRLRGIKTSEEVAALERSASMADRVYGDVLPLLQPGVTERAVQSAITERFAQLGAESSWAIVAFGANASRPHHRSGGTQLENGMVIVLDLGGSLDGYQSDITRTVVYGRPDPEVEKVYSIVHSAHMAALASAVPGNLCADVDRAARAVIEQAGYGKRFLHRTGHGIGLSTHEPPNLAADDFTVLQPGMCFSDEPGIYFPGRYGVRIENIIALEGVGARSLNAAAPSTLPILGDQGVSR